MAAILKVKDGNGNVIPIQAIKGEKGDKGDKGDKGEQGLPGGMSVVDPAGTGSFSMNRKELTDIGEYSTTEGLDNAATAKCAHAEGANNEAAGRYSHVEGWGNSTGENANNAHVEGVSSYATAPNAHAEGNFAKATGQNAHAEGSGCTASGQNAHAEGSGCTASGQNAHAEGNNSLATGETSHAEGWSCEANGAKSHAEGGATVASGAYQHVQGKHNISDTAGTYAHIVGNGTADNKKNIHTVDWSGNAWFEGDVYVGSTGGKNKDAGSKKLATEEYVNNHAGSGSGSYTLPIASSTTLGGVKIGSGISVGDDGTISASGGDGEWKQLMDYTVTDDDVANSVSDFQFQTQDDANAKEIYLYINWKVVSNANFIVKARYVSNGNQNYIANVCNGFGARNGYNMMWHFARKELSGFPIIDWEWSPGDSYTSDFNTGKYSKTGQYSTLHLPMNGIYMRPYGWEKVDGNEIEYGLLAGTRFRGWWR